MTADDVVTLVGVGDVFPSREGRADEQFGPTREILRSTAARSPGSRSSPAGSTSGSPQSPPRQATRDSATSSDSWNGPMITPGLDTKYEVDGDEIVIAL